MVGRKLFEASQSKETEFHRGQMSKVFSFSTLVGFLKYVLINVKMGKYL